MEIGFVSLSRLNPIVQFSTISLRGASNLSRLRCFRSARPNSNFCRNPFTGISSICVGHDTCRGNGSRRRADRRASRSRSRVSFYRREPRELAEKLGVDCSKMDGPTVPIVYSVSFVDPAGYFLATRVQMHNKDVLFAANAQSVDITKFANFVNTLISVPNNVATLGTNIEVWRINSSIR